MQIHILLLKYAMIAEILVAGATLAAMVRRKLLRTFCYVASYLFIFTAGNALNVSMLFFRREIGISKLLAYNVYFCTRWACFFLLTGLILLIIRSVFSTAMKPMKGLHKVGKIIFRWIFAVSFVVCIGIAIDSHGKGLLYSQSLWSQIQQATSILTLCLLLFVCFSIRHLGLTYRSHIFGISLGLGIMATVSLVESAFYTAADSQPLYSTVYLYSALGACAALLVWTTYFALPEPEARMILLPTTSPYFLWNYISEALDDDPGYVAVAGFTPSMLAEPEMAVILAQGEAVARTQRVNRGNVEAELFAEVHSSIALEASTAQPVYAMQS